MVKIPEIVRNDAVVETMKDLLIAQGKVGDKYDWPSSEPLLVSVRSNRLSVFDFVLPLLVPMKGEVLTALTHFWAKEILGPLGIEHHLAGSDKFLTYNAAKDLKEIFPDVDLNRTLVVEEAQIVPTEFIFRGHLGGSVWKSYQATGLVAGIKLPDGLKKWEQLSTPLFTPSTKAEEGHDVNINVEEFLAETEEFGLCAVEMLELLYSAAYEFAYKRGILILDTKFEVGFVDGELVLCDEWLTPDSSRIVLFEDFVEALDQGREPNFYDKQPVRDFCATIKTPFKDESGEFITGLSGLDPTNDEHLAFVAEYPFPDEIVSRTTDRYLEIFKLLTGFELQEYQRLYLQ